jgi:hypothetical protein
VAALKQEFEQMPIAVKQQKLDLAILNRVRLVLYSALGDQVVPGILVRIDVHVVTCQDRFLMAVHVIRTRDLILLSDVIVQEFIAIKLIAKPLYKQNLKRILREIPQLSSQEREYVMAAFSRYLKGGL